MVTPATEAPAKCGCGDVLDAYPGGAPFCNHCDRPFPHKLNQRCYRCINLSKASAA